MSFQFVDQRFSFNQPVTAEFHRYRGSNNIAIQLVDEGGTPWCMASVNVPDEILGEDVVALKTYSENEGIDSILVSAGVIENPPVRYIGSGFVMIPVYRLTEAARKEVPCAN